MKSTIYLSIGLVTAAAIAWMVYDAMREKTYVPSVSFAIDDEKVYNQMRNDLKTYLENKGDFYGAWLDDQVLENYNSGSNINGQASKSMAFYTAAVANYPGKTRWYGQLIDNLKNRTK